jgi:DNA-directed RNA polymerase beta subunit
VPQQQPNLTFREFDDVDTTRDAVETGVLSAIQNKYKNIENDRYQLRLENVRYEKPDLRYSMDEQKAALMKRQSLSKRIRGQWTMVDRATGEVVDKRDDIVAHVPYLTNRGTYIYNGNEYTVANQMRLRPGVYTRKKANGQYEAHFNVLPGTGRAFRVHMDPDTGVFKAQIGQAHIPLYPVMRAMGMTDKQLEEAWGRDLLTANREKDDPKALEKMYKRMIPHGSSETPADRIREIQAEFERMRMEPDIVQRSLGQYLGGA